MPWAEPGLQLTATFEALAIDWLQQASVTAVSKQLRIPRDDVNGHRKLPEQGGRTYGVRIARIR